MASLVLLSGFIALAMAWAIGAQDVSNALGTSVGSKALTVNQAIIVGTVCEFLGSLSGGEVANTISGGILVVDAFDEAHYVICMFATMTGAFIWLAVATLYSLPVSTTHSLIGALVGVGVASQGVSGVQWTGVLKIAYSWVTSPLLGGAIAYSIFKLIHVNILTTADPIGSADKYVHYFTASTLGVCVVFLCLVGPYTYRLSWPTAVVCGLVMTAAYILVRFCNQRFDSTARPGEDEPLFATGSSKNRTESYSEDHDALKVPPVTRTIQNASSVELGGSKTAGRALTKSEPVLAEAEQRFMKLMIVTACVVAFAHGSNDVSNSIGPFGAILVAYGYVDSTPEGPKIPFWVLFAGGVGIVVGLATYGYRVMETIGSKIAKLTYARGFAAQVGTAVTVLTATQMGISVSTTHCLIGAISGVGLVEGRDKLNFKTLRHIVFSWIITIPAAAASSIVVLELVRFGILPSS